jgi:cyclopropane-fatty-acyl-phospholipid synthase
MENLSTLSKVSSVISGLSNAFLGQSHTQSRLNAIASYDQSNDLFKVPFPFYRSSFLTMTTLKSFLSEEMMYSCALWDRPEGGVYGDIEAHSGPRDLEAAQRRKIFHVLRKARVKAGDRVLEFGTGWGGLAIEVPIVLLFSSLY